MIYSSESEIKYVNETDNIVVFVIDNYINNAAINNY